MLSPVWVWVGDLAALLSPFGTDSRLHWTGLAAFFGLGFLVYLAQRRRAQAQEGPTRFLAFLFPREFYRTQSSWVDVKVYVAGRLIKPFMNAVSVPLGALVSAVCASLVVGGSGLPQDTQTSPAAIVAASLLVAVLNDLAYYVTHRLSHESPLFWPFHKLHHSAEVLTPITAKRNHPVFDLLKALVTILITAPVYGVIYGLFGVVEFTTIFGLSVLIAVMNLAGGALRHSHIWLDYGPVFDRIFISPAQHQIHHSLDPRHHDRNYGLNLAIWDWMFGTLYVPKGREALTFGVADRDGNPLPQRHTTLKSAYLVPFEEAFATGRKQRAAPVAEERA